MDRLPLAFLFVATAILGALPLSASEADESPIAGTETWVSLGPTDEAGRMTRLAAHPSAPGTLYAGSAGGGLWRTVDGGASWTSLGDSLPTLWIGGLALASSAPATLYVGTGGHNGGQEGAGILKSLDGGSSWSRPRESADGVFRISVHPLNPDLLVAGTTRGAVRSTDGGRTWRTVIDPARFGFVMGVERDPGDPDVLYATTHDRQKPFVARPAGLAPPSVLKSTDGGATWATIDLPLPDAPAGRQLTQVAVGVSPTVSGPVYVAAQFFNPRETRMYRSADAGSTWVDHPIAGVDRYFGLGWYEAAIAVSPENPNMVLVGGGTLVRSDDGGATWKDVPRRFFDISDLRYQGGTLYAATDRGVWRSSDDGATFVPVNQGLVTKGYEHIANDPSDRHRILACSGRGAEIRPGAGGGSWTSTGPGNGCLACAIDPERPSTAYVVLSTKIYRTREFGDRPPRWEEISPPYPAEESSCLNSAFMLDPNDSRRLYTGCGRLWKSEDGGDTWRPLPTAMNDGSRWPDAGAIDAVAVAPGDPERILLARYGVESVFRSADGGRTWARADRGLPSSGPVNTIAIDPESSEVAYAGINGRENRGLVYGTRDGGRRWTRQDAGLPASARGAFEILIDPYHPARLYCATSVGVYVSSDRARSWSRLGKGLPNATVYEIALTRDGLMLRAASYGRGVWELSLP